MDNLSDIQTAVFCTESSFKHVRSSIFHAPVIGEHGESLFGKCKVKELNTGGSRWQRNHFKDLSFVNECQYEGLLKVFWRSVWVCYQSKLKNNMHNLDGDRENIFLYPEVNLFPAVGTFLLIDIKRTTLKYIVCIGLHPPCLQETQLCNFCAIIFVISKYWMAMRVAKSGTT